MSVKFGEWVAGCRKAAVALTTALTVAVSQGLIEGTAAKAVAVLVAIAGVYGVYKVSNVT